MQMLGKGKGGGGVGIKGLWGTGSVYMLLTQLTERLPGMCECTKS